MTSNEITAGVDLLVSMVLEGDIVIASMVHNIDLLCRDMVNNDFTQYKRIVENLDDEIKMLRKRFRTNKELAEFRGGYLNSLIVARERVHFWKLASHIYYGRTNREHINQRFLPHGRINLRKREASGVIGQTTINSNELGKANITKSKSKKCSKIG